MAYKLVFSEEALSQLRKLDNKIASRIIEKLESAIDHPVRFFHRLAGREDYKLRVGDYRVLVKLLHNEGIIFVLSLGHRKNIYRK
ncbi:MAG TPA: type II toxin-antitoxin system RelE/ParE family toxin [Candidatus Bilamarchaeaceae archaeon]|nr:type II toxin-antitoxin system RelE/ParE family toxin [Candidatus Bilamarchaeaceae archaeon]